MSAATGGPPAGSAVSGPGAGGVLAIRDLSKVYPGGQLALDGVSIDVMPGEFMVVLGPTGSGKSTLLRLIAGLDHPTGGQVLIDGQRVDDEPVQQRQVAMVFQDFALYPHLSVRDNIGFPLRIGHVPDADDRVRRAAELLDITDLLDRYPSQLSGGQRQRVAMGRAIVREPKVFLFDEPLSNVDAALRAELRTEIALLARQLRVTTVYVTHDQPEAMALADRVAVLFRGRLQQVGTPEEVYGDPATVFVAAFLGTPMPNLVQAAINVGSGGWVEIDLGGQLIRMDASDPRARSLARHHTERITVALRADALSPIPSADRAEPAMGGRRPGAPDTAAGDRPLLRGTCRLVEDLGHEVLVHVDAGLIGTAPELFLLDLTDPDHHLGELAADDPPPAGRLRHTVSRMVTRHRDAWSPTPTARTRYGFYPAYEADGPVPASDLVVRVPAPRRPRIGESLTFSVDLDRLFLFDHHGARIRLT